MVDLKELPLIHSYDSIQALNRTLDKGDRGRDLVISVSYSKFIITFCRIDYTYLAVAPLFEEIMVFCGIMLPFILNKGKHDLFMHAFIWALSNFY